MKVLLVNEKTIQSYILPKETNNTPFVINYKDFNIYLNLINNKWIINNTNIILKEDNKLLDDKELKEYNNYSLTIKELDETINIICLPIKKDNYKDYKTINQISIGTDSNNNIILNNIKEDIKVGIKEIQSKTIIASNKRNIYINNIACKEKELEYGDIIFIQGLIIIWMKDFIRINTNPNVTIKDLPKHLLDVEDNSKYKELTSKEKKVNLYKETDYFIPEYNNPKEKENTIITIDNLHIDENKSQISLIITLIVIITLAIYSISTVLISITNILKKNSTFNQEKVPLIICTIMIILSILCPLIIKYIEKKNIKNNEKIRINKYKEYLDEKRKQIKKTIKLQGEMLNNKYLSAKDCYKIIDTKNKKLWSRKIDNKDFLKLRLGLGTIDSNIEIDIQKLDFTLEDSILKDKLKEIESEKLLINNAPTTISLKDNNIFSIINNSIYPNTYINSLMLQLITYHSPNNLKIVILSNEENKTLWDKYRYLPHIEDDNQKIRLLSYNNEDIKEVSSYLDSIYKERISIINNSKYTSNRNYYKEFDEYYLIITDNINKTIDIDIVNEILHSEDNYGFSLLIIDNLIKNIPNICNNYCVITDKEGTLILNNNKEFTPEFINIDMNEVTKKLSNIPIISNNIYKDIPDNLDFLSMYKIGKVEELNIKERWKTNDSSRTLKVPIGIHPSKNIFELDLQNNQDGPHLLVSGEDSTDFLLTYIISLCINYNPNDIQILLIDNVKGILTNSLFNYSLPHIIGTLTSTASSDINRISTFINREIERRKKIFDETKEKLKEPNIDINKYQKYIKDYNTKEPVSHLFIIIDEIKDYIDDNPDFIDELIDIVKEYEYLGIHLIISNDIPIQSINDKINSIIKTKICFKVNSLLDSRMILNKNDAYYLKNKGRFYLYKTDNNIEIGQLGSSNNKYEPKEYTDLKDEDEIVFISTNGKNIKTISTINSKKEDNSYQYDQIIKNIIDVSKKEKYKNKELLIPSLKEEIYLGNTMTKYSFEPSKEEYLAVIGEYDDPENNTQNILTLNMEESGNVIIYGLKGSGKENQIKTMVYSLNIYYSPKELNVYIMDFNEEHLKSLSFMPQIGDYITNNDNNKISNLAKMLELEYKKRLNNNYNYLIVTIINNYAYFKKNYPMIKKSYDELFQKGKEVGIIFIITVNNPDDIKEEEREYFETIYGLKFQDSFDYRYLLNAKSGLIPKDIYGRGLTKLNNQTVEYQIANINKIDKVDETIQETAKDLCDYFKIKTKTIPTIPTTVTSNTLSKYITNLSSVPMGVSTKTISIIKYNLLSPRITIITGNNIKMNYAFLQEFYKLLTNVPNINLSIFDSFYNTNIPESIPTLTNANEFIQIINNVITKKDQPKEQRVTIIAGIKELLDSIINEEDKETFKNILENINKYQNTSIIIIDDYNSLLKISKEKWYNNSVIKDSGIWIGPGLENQELININSKLEDSLISSKEGYIIKEGKATVLNVVTSDEIEK